MGYKAYGFYIEGIDVDTTSLMPAMWGAGMIQNASQYVPIGASNFRWKPNACIDFPQFSSNEIDPMSGELRAGGVKIKLTASDEVCFVFLNQAISRNNVATLAANVDVADTQITLTATTGFTVGALFYLNEEVIRIDSLDTGTTFNVTRALGDTQAMSHLQDDAIYTKPPYWIGRKITFVEFDLPDRLQNPITPTNSKIIWTGFLNANPKAVQSTSSIEISADSVLDIVRNIRLNKNRNSAPANRIVPGGARDILGNVTSFTTLTGGVPFAQSRTKKEDFWLTNGDLFIIAQIEEDEAVAAFQPQVLVRGPLFDSRYDLSNNESRKGLAHELWIVSKDLDALLSSDISVTSLCDYPYHPLTVAAAILFSTNNVSGANGATFDVCHPNWACDLGQFADLQAWTDLIEETSYLEVDDVILGWNGEEFSPWDYIVNQLLPAFSFQLSINNDGKLIPIEVGIIDVEEYINSNIIQPLPEQWEWLPYSLSLLDGFNLTIGERPWIEGERVTITGNGVRDRILRSNKVFNQTVSDADWPFFRAGDAQVVALYYAMQRLAWRFDGLPSVSFQIDANVYQPYLGEVIRLAKPDGLITDILFDTSGVRVDGWADVPFICQITSVRPNIKNGAWDVEGLLVLYAFGKYAKWRAPAARIKSRPNNAEYLIEGVDSDFNDIQSDALKFTVGDEVYLYTKSLDLKSSTSTNIISITPSGSDYIIALNVDFVSIGATGDWLIISDSPTYFNDLVVGSEEPYPYVFMTDNATLTRPGPSTDDPDEYS